MSFAAAVARIQQSTTRIIGVDYVYTRAAGGSLTVRGIFDNEYFGAEMLGVEIERTGPVLDVRLSDFSGTDPVHSDTVVVDATTYIVRKVDPDGRGMVTLHLEEQP